MTPPITSKRELTGTLTVGCNVMCVHWMGARKVSIKQWEQNGKPDLCSDVKNSLCLRSYKTSSPTVLLWQVMSTFPLYVTVRKSKQFLCWTRDVAQICVYKVMWLQSESVACTIDCFSSPACTYNMKPAGCVKISPYPNIRHKDV